jgi:OOP family OmpA-OmpF porin
MKAFRIFLFLLVLGSCVSAQNLVSNPGFEECTKGESALSKYFTVNSWFPANGGSPDYFTTGHNSTYPTQAVPDNFAGSCQPHSGKAYAGLIAYSGEIMDFKEYLEVPLQSVLVKDAIYKFQMYAMLGQKSKFALEQVGVCFSAEPLKKSLAITINIRPDILIDSVTLEKSQGWVLYSGTYKAKGGEHYLTIGNFFLSSPVYVNDKRSKFQQAYYYIDDVSLECLTNLPDKPIDTTVVVSTLNIPVDQPYILKNIFFETSSATLKPESEPELNALVAYLVKTKPLSKIVIRGYTDNVGLDSDNQRLSESRARAVADYLILKGVQSSRITCQGFGSKNPIADNATESGRAQNRRVEVIISE